VEKRSLEVITYPSERWVVCNQRPYAPRTTTPTAMSATRLPATTIAIRPPVHLDGVVAVTGAAVGGGSGSGVGSLALGSAMVHRQVALTERGSG
jgi:hypothetical protein